MLYIIGFLLGLLLVVLVFLMGYSYGWDVAMLSVAKRELSECWEALIKSLEEVEDIEYDRSRRKN